MKQIDMYLYILFLLAGNEIKKNKKLFKCLKKLQPLWIITGWLPSINNMFSLQETSTPINFKNIDEMITWRFIIFDSKELFSTNTYSYKKK